MENTGHKILVKKNIKIAFFTITLLLLSACGSGSGGSSSTNNYSYIPKGEALTDRMAVKFLDMSTMGSTPAMVKELREKGVVVWVDEQLAKKWDYKKESIVYNMMHDALKMRPHDYCEKANVPIPKTEAEIDDLIEKFLADNDTVFNRTLIHGADELTYHSSAIFAGHMEDDAQLRQKIAYVLSQIVIVSESNDFLFKNRGEALSYYYDILLKNAFGTYSNILYNATLSPAMATYLTYANNRKVHTDEKTGTTVAPDENYGREIMQLFSIGLFELNTDGTARIKQGKKVPTYTQKDVEEISRVFTGMSYSHDVFNNKGFNATLWRGDSLHPLLCVEKYHDSEEKEFLGQTLAAGQSCFQDVNNTIKILMNHPNSAPFIAKKLILRLTKSNPNTDYVQRVAEVFKSSGGDLGKTVKAILLDAELWEDIKNDSATKIKEPYLAYTNMLRALDVEPWPLRTVKDDDGTTHTIKNRYFVRSKYQYLNQWPTFSPTVFNFYSDTYEPDSEVFKTRALVAPEAQILTTKYIMGITNNAYNTLHQNEYNYLLAQSDGNETKLYKSHPGLLNFVNLLLNFEEYVEYFRISGKEFKDGPKESDGRAQAIEKIINDASQRLLGKKLNHQFVQKLVESYRDVFTDRYPSSWDNNEIKSELVSRVIAPVITELVMSQEYMVQ